MQETGSHLVFECPENEEARKRYINGARTWEDLDDKTLIKEGEWKVEASLEMLSPRKAQCKKKKKNSSKGWG